MIKNPISFACMSLGAALCFVSCDTSTPLTDADPIVISDEYYAGGINGTVFNTTTACFEQPSPAIEAMGKSNDFLLGEAFFENPFVQSPEDGSEMPFDGLGPVYIKESCIACHPGYGRAARSDDFSSEFGSGYVAMVHNPNGSICTGYQFMLQIHAESPMVPPASDVTIDWREYKDQYDNKYPDGTPYNAGTANEGSLIYPVCDIVDPYYPLPDDYRVTIEGTMGIYGTALIDAITDADILKEEARQQGLTGDVAAIKGRAGSILYKFYGDDGIYIEEAHLGGEKRLGRFTWHNTRATIQNGPGYNGMHSIGNITRSDKQSLFANPLWIQHQLDLHEAGTITLSDKQLATLENELLPADEKEALPIEINDEEFEQFMIWHRGLAVPAARNLDDPVVMQGKELFVQAKCAECHKPSWTTGDYAYIPGYSQQTIRPYTDLLMHDMGLDGKADYVGRYSEYKTPALWGRGLMPIAANHSDMFHDQRARGFEEAILWHFGEAEVSREAFREMSKDDRDALIEFCKSI